jgi:Catenin-beta-like, Arm-motif containing nuclear
MCMCVCVRHLAACAMLTAQVDLDEAIKQLHTLATSPELYALFARLNAVHSLVALLEHPNADVALDVVHLFKELFEPDAFTEDEAAIALLDGFREAHGLEMLIAMLTRLDEKESEDAVGVYTILGIVENLVGASVHRPLWCVCSWPLLTTWRREGGEGGGDGRGRGGGGGGGAL